MSFHLAIECDKNTKHKRLLQRKRFLSTIKFFVLGFTYATFIFEYSVFCSNCSLFALSLPQIRMKLTII